MSNMNAATGLGAKALATTDGLISMEIDENAADEGYSMTINEDGVTVAARTAAGFFYAFQTIKKMLPANVMAGLYDDSIDYFLPCLTIQDEPRFGYRGFMLDVSRHFFTIEEVKRMIDIMATYKMNRFHWHLTDDQGWRAEIKAYPKLTTVGATADNCRVTDMTYGTYWTNAEYGPYFYTQDEMHEMLEYCKERHIEIIPEVDMPGHFVAAMASYPEYSCTPNNPPTVWTTGGVSSNVLNVGDENAIKFIKNILDELCDIFPAPYFHIGGDECPTTQWESNSDCKALYAELGLTSYRALQSYFINEISAYLTQKGKRAVVWNESITASGADIDKATEYDPVIMCWSPCQSSAAQAAELGLQNVVTEYHSTTNGLGGGYYINRKQSTDASEPDGAGDGNDSVEGCYAYVPMPDNTASEVAQYYTGVQGTFWCEWVANREYLEYLALPRLMAVAEAGWTQQADKDFSDFVSRMAQDTLMLNMGGYQYGRHIFASLDDMVKPVAGAWYTLQTLATDGRSGTCIELLSESSDLISQYAGYNAAANRLWNNAVANEDDDNYDYQQWTFEEDTSTGLYAMVCKAQPDGSVNPTPTATNNTGRWNYDTDKKNYSFVLGDGGYGNTSNGNVYYTIRASQISGWYMNSSLSGQGYAVNLWNNAADGNSGMWEFVSHDDEDSSLSDFDQELFDSLPKMQEKDTIRISCSVEGFENVYISDRNGESYIGWTDGDADNIDWIAYDVTEMDSNYCQTAVLRNIYSKRYIYKPESGSTGNIGYPVTANTGYSNAPIVTLQYQSATNDYQIFVNGRNLYPVSLSSVSNPGIVSSGNTANSSGLAVRPQGAAWIWEKVESTAVQSPTSERQPLADGVYNLMGQKLTNATQNGIYIIDGQKQVVH